MPIKSDLEEACEYSIDCVILRTNELIKQYPDHKDSILRALDVSSKMESNLSREQI